MKSGLLAVGFIVIISTSLSFAFGSGTSGQFWLPGVASDGNCHMRSYTLTLYKGGGVEGTVLSNNPIYTLVISFAQSQAVSSDPNACSDLPTMGFINSGPTTNYDLFFIAPYNATQANPFVIFFLNIGAAGAEVTVNMATFPPGQ
jgi:hypothetical protein